MTREVITEKTGHHFQSAELLRQALTHRSYGAVHNERLEFLGDAVLNCVIAAELYRLFPQLSEGDLSRLRANLVNQRSLHEIAVQLELGKQLRLGDGEVKSGGARRPSILADALEAVIGAVYLDGGFERARKVVLRLYKDSLQGLDPQSPDKDAKTQLQEYLQARHIPLPQYRVLATTGEAHKQKFCVECSIPELAICTQGEGTSRRGAEQDAARRAYQLSSRS